MYRLLGAARVSPSPSDTANRPEKLAREPKQRASCVKRARQNGRAQTGVEPGGTKLREQRLNLKHSHYTRRNALFATARDFAAQPIGTTNWRDPLPFRHPLVLHAVSGAGRRNRFFVL